jgi:RHS repeat-associated protein
MDGMGHTVRTELVSDPEGKDFTDTTYDGLGRVYSVSNPYRSTSDGTYGLTTYSYDALNRVTSVVEQEGSKVSTSYTGNCTTVTDEAGHARESCVDGLGRMTKVLEDPGSSPHLNYETDYTYDALNNLTNVNQKGSDSAKARVRTFAYDSFSRLTSATNPESGTITYKYDNNGNVTTKIAPAPNQTGTATVTTTYGYDALNRLTSKSYSDGTTPSYSYNYDVVPTWMTDLTNIIGRLSFSGSQYGGTTAGLAVSSTYSYDAMGRVLRKWQQTPSTSPGGKYIYSTYDLAGNRTSTTSPANHTISYGYDGASRLTSVASNLVDAQHPATLWSADATLGYYPHGAVKKAKFGNGLTEAPLIEPRLQVCRLVLDTSGGIPTGNCSQANPSGVVQYYQYVYGNWGTTNSGNVTEWIGSGVQSFDRTFAYDALNRIQSMSDSVSSQPCRGLSWTIDAWGNMTAQNNTGGSCNTFSASVGTNNQLQSGYQYDAAGNMTYDGLHHYTYDAENRITQVDGGSTASYVYNEEGKRARKNIGSGFTEYYYGPNGQVQGEYNGSSWPVEYVYAGSRLIAEYTNGTTKFIFADHLGTTRLVTAMDQSIVDNLDYLPFGQQITGASATTHKFTGKERDAESGDDYFGARYYSSTMGRFLTPDWAARATAVPYAVFGDPQTLNLYTYVENAPLNRADADGHGDPTLRLSSAGVAGDFAASVCQTFDDSCGSRAGSGFVESAYAEVADWLSAGLGTQSAQNQSQTQTQQNQQSPQRGLTVAVGVAGNADVGVGKAGVETNATVVATASISSSGKPSVGVAASGAATAYAGDHVAAAPKQETKPLVAGAYAGGGVTFVIANTANSKGLSGPFQTISGNVGGGQGASVALSFDHTGTFVLQITLGPGLGVSGWSVTTNTKAGCAGCE